MAEDTPTDSDADNGESPNQEEDGPDSDAAGNQATSDTAPTETAATSDAVVDGIADTLTDEGFNVFHGREFITFREDGKLAPNSTVVEQYLQDTAAMMLGYNDSSNEAVIVPLEQEYDRADVYGYTGNTTEISARGFLKVNDIVTDETIRYTPEWDGSLGGDDAAGGFRIDLDQDGEVVNIDLSDDTNADSNDDETASAD